MPCASHSRHAPQQAAVAPHTRRLSRGSQLLRGVAVTSSRVAATAAAAGTVAAAAALPPPPPPPFDLRGRAAAILWDADNIRPAGGAQGLARELARLQALVRCCGAEVAATRVYANTQTLGALGGRGVLAGALAPAGAELVAVAPRREAADVRLDSDAYAFVRARGDGRAAALVCVSGDKGFARVLAHCTSLGAFTAVVARFRPPRYAPRMAPDVARDALARACYAALVWPPAPHGGEEEEEAAGDDDGDGGGWRTFAGYRIFRFAAAGAGERPPSSGAEVEGG